MRLPKPRWRVRALIVAVALVVTAVAVPVAMAAIGRDSPPSGPGENVPVPSEPAAVTPSRGDSRSAPAGPVDPGYWTEKRMREASGASMPADDG